MVQQHTRRTFVKSVGVAGAAVAAMPKLARAQSANSRVNVAFVATGGKGDRHIQATADFGHNCTAFCDIDTRLWGRPQELWPESRGYQDYREMFEKEHRNIDAVFIATPDHHHYLSSMIALKYDIHCFTQKPLTWSVWEARKLAEEAASRPYLATQMGNQGHSGEGWRLVSEWVRAGLIGDVTEVHSWTNRPIWPQGLERPAGSDPVPEEMDWDKWIGPAPMRPFSLAGDPGNRYSPHPYHPFSWRGWFDFGAGALGDMACHTMDGLFMALDANSPDSVERVFVEGLSSEQFPNASTIKWTFPAKGNQAAFTHYWYDGTKSDGNPNKPEAPAALAEAGRNLPRTGNLFVGSKGMIIVSGDYGDSPRPFPDALVPDAQAIPKTMRRAPEPADYGYVEAASAGRGGRARRLGHFEDKHHLEFFLAASGDKPAGYCLSNFGFAGPMTEVIQLGNVALRVGEKLMWDAENMVVTNVARANDLIYREPRTGWDTWL